MDKYKLDEKARKQIRQMLFIICGNPMKCRKCERDIWFLPTRNSKMIPYTDDAVSHFADCPSAGEFRK